MIRQGFLLFFRENGMVALGHPAILDNVACFRYNTSHTDVQGRNKDT